MNISNDLNCETEIAMIPRTSGSPAVTLDSRSATSLSVSPLWEYKIGILCADTAATPADGHEEVLNTLSKKGWILIGESRGMFQLKRLKL